MAGGRTRRTSKDARVRRSLGGGAVGEERDVQDPPFLDGGSVIGRYLYFPLAFGLLHFGAGFAAFLEFGFDAFLAFGFPAFFGVFFFFFFSLSFFSPSFTLSTIPFPLTKRTNLCMGPGAVEVGAPLFSGCCEEMMGHFPTSV